VPILVANATILVVIKASLCSNNWLLEANLTLRTAKIVVLDTCAYPELRLSNHLSASESKTNASLNLASQ